MSLSLCMIVKNEEDNLSRCLDSVKDIVDEMIIVDTGSTDSTVDIIKSYGAKPYYYEWNDNFSDARNYSLEQATCDWILIMDADDELERDDKQLLLELIRDLDAEAYFTHTLCYVGDKPGSDVIMNLNVRVIKNNKDYRFTGAIHEQIGSNIVQINKDAKIMTIPVRFHHYGYMDKDVAEKNKRERNIRIIEGCLSENPEDTFMLFSMGNEYYSMGDYNRALEYYTKSYEKFNPNIGFSSKLVIRMVMAYDELRLYDKALGMIDEGLMYFPEYTDLEYLRGCILHKQGKYTLSIQSYKKCISMGEAPAFLQFIIGVGGFRAYNALSEIHYLMEDYDEAYKYAIEALRLKPEFTPPFYRIAKILIKKENDIGVVKYKLEEFFGDTLDAQAFMVLADIFMGENKYDVAYEYILKVENLTEENINTIYLKGLCLLYMKNFETANEYFKKIPSGEFYQKSVYSRIFCEILDKKMKNAAKLLNIAKQFNDDRTRTVYSTFKKIIEGKKCKPICDDKQESVYYLNSIVNLVNTLLKIAEFETFEKSLQLLNLIESDEVLLVLAKLYYNYGFYNLAYQEFIRSIKEFDRIDYEGIEMMRKISMGNL